MTDLLTESDVRDRLREAVQAAGSQRAWAREHGVSEQYLSDVLLGRRTVGQPMLAAMRLCKVAYYHDCG